MSAAEKVHGQWEEASIPSSWKSPPTAEFKKSGGFAWFRCGVKIPVSWTGREASLFVEPVDDARQTFVNGRKVGDKGTIPKS